MSHVEDHKDDNYAGPSKTIEALGKANAVGWGGSVAGLLGGGLFASASTKENSELAQKGGDFIKWISRGKWHISGKWPVIIGSALIGSQIVHWATYFVTFGHALPKAGKGQEQFHRLKTQRDDARNELQTLKEEREALIKEIALDHGKGIHDGSTPNNVVMADGIQSQKETAPQTIASL